MLALERPGASGDQGVYADRIELEGIKARFPLPDFVGRVQVARELGLRPHRRHAAAHQLGRHPRRRGSICRETPPAGDERQLEPQRQRERRPAAAVHRRRRHPELNERLARRHRHREQPANPVTPVVGKAIPIVGLQRVPRSHLEQEATPPRSATRARTTTTPMPRRLTPSSAASTRSATCSTRRCRT